MQWLDVVLAELIIGHPPRQEKFAVVVWHKLASQFSLTFILFPHKLFDLLI